MEQMQTSTGQVLPHIVQVYQPTITDTKIQSRQIIHLSHPPLTSQSNVYQQPMSEPLHMPSQHIAHEISQIQTSQNLVMSCQQTHLQSLPLQGQMSSQVLQPSAPLQITSHVILPQAAMFKQHMLVNSVQQQYYSYEAYQKDEVFQKECVAKIEPGLPAINDKQIECKPEQMEITHHSIEIQIENITNKRSRSLVPNPNQWACNIRKLKHQRGEAYISRRGKYVPERRVRNTKDCLKTCKYKCNERIDDTDREHIFKAFYSLNANEKKHFLLNTTERNYVKHNKLDADRKRKYSFKYFFLVRAVRYTVCKNFYLGTLAISQKPVYNVHLTKSEMNIPKPDGRGLNQASAHAMPQEIKDKVRNHILSFNTLDGKQIKQFSRKKQYLDSSLSIKQMYTMYFNECSKDNSMPVKESMYRKIFKQEFNLHFKKTKDGQLCCRCKGPVKKKSS
ncbi:uncharacterized protein LOC133525537 [Cydia pomonella]|uniref:uncharacterized protein LOC133525537 n=1 Tax=Cydia pomonella TaxID=82600 RepID=UPI002ADD6D7A|nr:uncharacterized protein LOC133525537 [Cydia pomonella]